MKYTNFIHFNRSIPYYRSGRNLNTLWSKISHKDDIESIATKPSSVSSIQVPNNASNTDETNESLIDENESYTTDYKYINNVKVPLKPRQPNPDECCMSGCVNCTYDIYADSLTSYLSAAPKAVDKLIENEVDKSLWPSDLIKLDDKNKNNQNVNEDAETQAEKAADDLVKGLDPTMRAFLEVSLCNLYIRIYC